MQEIPYVIGIHSLLYSKTTCFTLKNGYDRDLISVISYNYLIYNEI